MLPSLNHLFEKLETLYRINDIYNERRGQFTTYSHVAKRTGLCVNTVKNYVLILRLLGAPLCERAVMGTGLVYVGKGEAWTFTITKDMVISFMAKRRMKIEHMKRMGEIWKAKRENRSLNKCIKQETI